MNIERIDIPIFKIQLEAREFDALYRILAKANDNAKHCGIADVDLKFLRNLIDKIRE